MDNSYFLMHSSKFPTYGNNMHVFSSNKQTKRLSSGNIHLPDMLSAMLTRVFM
ncbi:hypothetical protein A2U01_0035796, partial [Trifolium medium]|nr:hypothetical protein [Trifolium medium]